MAWNIRRSIRLPAGFRMNISKSGLGYSWGFRGFRIGKGATGRVTRTVSIPGTGIYNRETLSRGSTSGRVTPEWSVGRIVASWLMLGFLLLTLVFLSLVFPVLWLLVILFIIIGIGSGISVALDHSNQIKQKISGVVPYPTEVASPPTYGLAQEVVLVRELVREPIKSEMRVFGVSSSFENYYFLSMFDLLTRFTRLGSSRTPQSGLLFLNVMGSLKPRTYLGFAPENANELMASHETLEQLDSPSALLMEYAVNHDRHNGTEYGPKLRGFMMRLAESAAATSTAPQAFQVSALEKLRLEIQDSNPDNPATLTTTSVAISPTDSQQSQPGLSNLAGGAIGANVLAPENIEQQIRNWIYTVNPLLKLELRRVRMATIADAIIETDLITVVLHFGIRDSIITDDSASLYLAIQRTMHPRRYADRSLDSIKSEMQGVFESGVIDYGASLSKPKSVEWILKSSLPSAIDSAKHALILFPRIASIAGANEQELESYRKIIEG